MNTAEISIGGKLYTGELRAVDTDEQPGQEQVLSAGSTLYPAPYQDAIEAAAMESWGFFLAQYHDFEPVEGVNYPEFRGSKHAWPRSEAKGALTVELPAGETIIDRPLYWPANIPMKGAGGSFDGSTLRFVGAGRLIILGDLETSELELVRAPFPVKPFGKTISGVYFVAEKSIGCVELWGDHQNLRIENCHFNTLGNEMVALRHDRGTGGYQETPFGTCYSSPAGPHLKELMITHCQFEYSLQAIHLIAPKRCTIQSNDFIYGDLGIGATEASDLHIEGNKFNGGATYGAIVETEARDNRIFCQSNAFNTCDLGAWLTGPDSEDVSDANNTFKGRFAREAVTVVPRGATLPFKAGVFREGEPVG